MRLALYAGASTALAAGVVVHAFNQRPNFYSACVYLSQSNLSLMILTNLTLFLVTFFVYALQRTFYGPLRPIEVEQLYEKGWFAITETCLAMTIFRDEVGAWFLVMFVALMAGKSWGWVGEGRVEVLEQQPPANPRLFHIRLSISLAMSIIYDMWFLAYTINAVVQQARPNMMVMFLFEFGILTACSYSTALRYGISLIEASVVKKQTQEMLEHRRHEIKEQRAEILRERAAAASSGEPVAENEPLPSEDDVEEMDIEPPGWETKGQWILTLDLMTDFVKLGIYTAFFFILLTFYGLPIHIMRDLFITARSFIKRLNAFLKYRNATRDMNQRYPDATVEEIEREDTCIICREEMRPWSVTNPAPGAVPNGVPQPPATRGPIISERSRPKKLPCGHVLHLGCLKSWLERQQVCPTCRRPVVDRPQPQMPVHGVQPHLPGQQPLPNIAGPGQLPIANANGARGAMINIGPLRLAFGRGPMPNMGAPNQPAQPGHQHAIPPNARVYGMELGFPPAPQAHGPAQGGPLPGARGADFHAQLEQVEAQIIQEIRSLSVAHAELRVVRNLQTELARLRQLQGIGSQQPIQQPLQQPPQQPPQHAAATGPLRPIFTTRTTSTERHGSAPGALAIQAGSSELPPGVTIPEGWTLLPLQNLDAMPPTTVADTSARPHGASPTGLGATPVPEPTPTTTGLFPAPPAVNLPSQAEQPIARDTSAFTDILGDLQATTPGLGDTPSTRAPAIPSPPSDAATMTEPSSPPAPSADVDNPAPSNAHETHEASLPDWSSTALFPGERPANGAASWTNPAARFAPSRADEGHSSAAAAPTNGRDGEDGASGGGAGEAAKAAWKGKGKAASVEEEAEEEG